jgi:hypothetical protein
MPSKAAKALTRTGFDRQKVAEIAKAMAQGLSQTAAAGEAGVLAQTLAYWKRNYPEVDELLTLAAQRRQAYLERGLLDDDNKMAQIHARIFALKNANPRDWQDQPAQHVAGLGNNIVVITGVPEAKEPVIEHAKEAAIAHIEAETALGRSTDGAEEGRGTVDPVPR